MPCTSLPVWASKSYGLAFGNDNLNTCKVNGMKLILKPEVAEMVAKLREEAFEAQTEKLAYLADVVRESPADAIGKNGKGRRSIAT